MICWRSKKDSGNELLEVKEGLWKWLACGQRMALEMVCWMSKKGLEMVCWWTKKGSEKGLLEFKERL
jgi:hypothetical protein